MRISSKITIRTLKKNVVSVAIIVLLAFIAVAITSGIGTLAPQLGARVDALYVIQNYVPSHVTDLTNSINAVSYIFPVFFVGVTILVVYISISRLIDIERAQMGCLRSLGFSTKKIVGKYLIFTGIASGMGAILGMVLGYFILSPILFEIIGNHFERLFYGIPPTPSPFPWFGVGVTLITIIFSLGITLLLILKTNSGAAANLLRPKAPIGTKRIKARKELPNGKNKEDIVVVKESDAYQSIQTCSCRTLKEEKEKRKGLPFRYKATARNLIRYKSRLFLTVFSMLFSTALVFVSIALSFVLGAYNPDDVAFIRPISAVLAIFSVSLCILVIYNITNINIEERRREIATLKVLGYRNLEVTGYIFREIFILGLLGIAVGLPAGFGFMVFLIQNMAFGSVAYISRAWYVFLITAAVTITGLFLTDLLLFRKIIKTDMLGSLKAVE